MGREVTGRRTAPKVFDRRVAAVFSAGLELETGGMRGVDVDVAAIQAFLLKRVDDEPTQRIGTNPTQPCHLEPEPRQADGDVAVGSCDTFVKSADAGQLAGLFGDEHRHGFTERQNIDLRHEHSPLAIGPSGRGP